MSAVRVHLLVRQTGLLRYHWKACGGEPIDTARGYPSPRITGVRENVTCPKCLDAMKRGVKSLAEQMEAV